MNWEEVSPSDQNGYILFYEILYEPQETFGGLIFFDTIYTINTSVLLDILHPFVNYSISVGAHTSVGSGPHKVVFEATYEDSKCMLSLEIT